MTTETYTVPCTVWINGGWTAKPATLQVRADYCPAIPATRDDPAEVESYEVYSVALVLTAEDTMTLTPEIGVWVEGGRMATVSIDVAAAQAHPDLPFELDDEDVRDEAAAWLLRQ